MSGIEMLPAEMVSFFGILKVFMLIFWALIMAGIYGYFLFLVFSSAWRILRDPEVLTAKHTGMVNIGDGLRLENP